MQDPISEAVYRAAEYGAGTDEVWTIPEDAVIKLGPDVGTSLWDGLTITFWGTDA